MVEMKIKITEDKKSGFWKRRGNWLYLWYYSKRNFSYRKWDKSNRGTKEKLNIDRGYEIVNHTSMSNEKILNELFNNL